MVNLAHETARNLRNATPRKSGNEAYETILAEFRAVAPVFMRSLDIQGTLNKYLVQYRWVLDIATLEEIVDAGADLSDAGRFHQHALFELQRSAIESGNSSKPKAEDSQILPTPQTVQSSDDTIATPPTAPTPGEAHTTRR